MEQHGRASDHDPLLAQIAFEKEEIPEVPEKDFPFTDVSEKAWSYPYISDLFNRDLIKGKSDTIYAPKDNLTRMQAVTILARIMKLEIKGTEKSPFTDISDIPEIYRNEINAAYQAGIINGFTATTFKPREFITRAQFALMLNRVYELKNDEYKVDNYAPFSDYGRFNNETKRAITMLYDLEVVEGYNGKYMPSKYTTREETAKIFSLFRPFVAK